MKRASHLILTDFPTVHGLGIGFWCPGCNELHGIALKPDMEEWNGDANRPTIHGLMGRRSVFRNGARHIACFSRVKDGMISFEAGTTHELRNQTVALFHLPKWIVTDE